MVRKLCEETTAEVFWSSEMVLPGLGKNHLGGKDRGEKTKKAVEKGHLGCL